MPSYVLECSVGALDVLVQASHFLPVLIDHYADLVKTRKED